MINSTSRVYIHRLPGSEHLWKWLCAQVNVPEDVPFVILIDGSSLHLQVMESARTGVIPNEDLNERLK